MRLSSSSSSRCRRAPRSRSSNTSANGGRTGAQLPHAEEAAYYYARLILMDGGDTERQRQARLLRVVGRGTSGESSF
jgi:hypothetical protein